jgi:hypothetical protein
MKQRSAKPTKKVAAYFVTGLVATALTYLVARLWHIDLPWQEAIAYAGILVTVAGGVVAWLVPPARDDEPVPAARRRRDPIGH